MSFNKSAVAAHIRSLNDAELDAVMRQIVSACHPLTTPGVETLEQVREIVDVITHERGKREKATAEHAILRNPGQA